MVNQLSCEHVTWIAFIHIHTYQHTALQKHLYSWAEVLAQAKTVNSTTGEEPQGLTLCTIGLYLGTVGYCVPSSQSLLLSKCFTLVWVAVVPETLGMTLRFTLVGMMGYYSYQEASLELWGGKTTCHTTAPLTTNTKGMQIDSKNHGQRVKRVYPGSPTLWTVETVSTIYLFEVVT